MKVLRHALITASLLLAAPAWSNPKASDFSLRDLAGDTLSLSSLEGQVVYVDFWATWCGPCKDEMPHLQKMYTELKEQVATLQESAASFDPVIQEYKRSLDLKESEIETLRRARDTEFQQLREQKAHVEKLNAEQNAELVLAREIPLTSGWAIAKSANSPSMLLTQVRLVMSDRPLASLTAPWKSMTWVSEKASPSTGALIAAVGG